ncbi:MAG TPA: hypothetical protein VIS99_16160, partial [Terrimicrobiaceae bacterium]
LVLSGVSPARLCRPWSAKSGATQCARTSWSWRPAPIASLAPARVALAGCLRQSTSQPPGCRWCFSIVERLEAIERKALILESHRAGQVAKAYLANDKIGAAKVAASIFRACRRWSGNLTRQRADASTCAAWLAKEQTASFPVRAYQSTIEGFISPKPVHISHGC